MRCGPVVPNLTARVREREPEFNGRSEVHSY